MQHGYLSRSFRHPFVTCICHSMSQGPSARLCCRAGVSKPCCGSRWPRARLSAVPRLGPDALPLFPQWRSGLAGSMPEPEPIALCRWERGLGRRAGWGSAPEVPLSTRSNRCRRDLTGDLVSPHCSETGDGWASAACLVGWVRRVPQEEGACHFRDRHNRWSQVKSLLSTNLHFF